MRRSSEATSPVILRSPTRQRLRRSRRRATAAMATARGYGVPAKAESRYGDGASEATKDLPPSDESRSLAALGMTRACLNAKSPARRFLLFIVAVLAAAGASAQPLASSLDSVGMTVADMGRAVDFYSKVLTFEKVSDVEVAGADYEHLEGIFGLRMRVVRMRLGTEAIELTEYLAPRGRPIPADLKSNDRSFQHIAIIVRDMDAAYRRLRENRVEHASSGPQRLPDWNKNAAGIKAFYFRDPDGHPLEILEFPEGKGDPKWHRSTDRLFLGIDHTAIVVGDTEASLKFYRDALGFRVAGESENYGVEQEHLNNVFGARLRITSVKPPAGPSVEFLEYLAPRDGRPAPPTRANDVLFRQTRVATSDAETAAKKLFAARAEFVSPGAVELTHHELGFRKGFLVRDPDGHAIELVEK